MADSSTFLYSLQRKILIYKDQYLYHEQDTFMNCQPCNTVNSKINQFSLDLYKFSCHIEPSLNSHDYPIQIQITRLIVANM